SEENPDPVFAKVDTEDQQELAASFGIRTIPTQRVVRDNTLVYAKHRALPKDSLGDLIKQALVLDVDDVRNEIDKQQDGDAQSWAPARARSRGARAAARAPRTVRRASRRRRAAPRSGRRRRRRRRPRRWPPRSPPVPPWPPAG